MGNVKNFLVNHLPSLGRYKRHYIALKDHVTPLKESYSQYGEDLFINSFLYDCVLDNSIYVDVGANHPTDISNTYLLYRQGYHGVIVEPNAELIDLHRKFRPRDIALKLGCSNRPELLKFNISKTPVISSFDTSRSIEKVWKQEFVPILPLDLILKNIPFSFINLLSIDVEGLNLQVLEGARESLSKTLLVCIEFDAESEIESYQSILEPSFELVKTIHCNLIYLNKNLYKQQKKNI